LGTDARASTAGTGADPGGDEPPIRLRGDELDLFAQFNGELFRTIRRQVDTSHETVEDACAFAWVEFLRIQPDRERNWRGWLVRTAQREAWRLTAAERSHVPDYEAPEFPDPADRYEQRLEFQAALQQLQLLPPRLQQVVLVNSQVWKQAEAAEILGVSRQRVAQLLVEAALEVAALNEKRHAEQRPVASPRSARLRELETRPPAWLTAAIGTLPARSKSSAGVVLAWRRAALAIDDYRTLACHDDADTSIGPRPIQPAAQRAWVRAERAIIEVANERERRSRGRSR